MQTKPSPSADRSSRQERTRRKILDAATQLFITYGVRLTTMEAIAASAQVAKATAYAHFANKEELFAAVILHAGEQMVAIADAAAAAAPTPEAAVLASLTSKQLGMYRMIHQSRHAAELLDAFTSVAGAESDAAHAHYVASLSRWLDRCPHVGEAHALAAATLLDHASYGLSGRATSENELTTHLALLVERVVGFPWS